MRSQRLARGALAAPLALVALAAACAQAAFAASPAPLPASEHSQPTGRAVVLVEPAARSARTRDRISTALEAAGVWPAEAIPELGAAAVEIPPSGFAAVRNELVEAPGVVRVTREHRLAPRLAPLVPNDPAWGTLDPAAPFGDSFQWHLLSESFAGAWARSPGTGADVAVIDTGVDASHPELAGRIADAVDFDARPEAGPPTVDENGHGTHVAALACADSNNGYAGASAGFGCNLIVEKTDFGEISIANAIVDATDRGTEVINMSFAGSSPSPVIRGAIEYAWASDVVMVAAASNRFVSSQGYPAEYLQPTGSGPNPSAGRGLVVTAAQYDDTPASFNPGHGTGISLAAYGDAGPVNRGIFAAFPGNATELEQGAPGQSGPCGCRAYFGEDDRFAYLRGTSMAAPQVAGAAALIRSAKPILPAARVIEVLKRSARPGTFTDGLGWGILDAKAALKLALKKKKGKGRKKKRKGSGKG